MRKSCKFTTLNLIVSLFFEALIRLYHSGVNEEQAEKRVRWKQVTTPNGAAEKQRRKNFYSLIII